MPTTSSSAPASWKRYALPVAVAAAIGCGLAFYFSPSDQAQERASSPGSATVFGPGALNNADTGMSLNRQDAPASLIQPPAGLASDSAKQLVINSALHEVIDFFLLQQAGPDGAASLRDYLKSKLPPPAYTQAELIADHYQAYMQAHDGLLAGQNLGDVNSGVAAMSAERLATWREQRDRLRLGMLGEQVVQAWYQDDDNRFAQALEELRQRNASTNVSPAPAGQSPANQEDDRQLQELIAEETKSFTVRKQEEMLWTSHFQAYTEAATRIKQQTGLSFAERERQLRAELAKLFPSEAQRQRARDLGP